MKELKRKNKRLVLIIILLGISLGYALLNATLTINGNSKILQQSWDIHWDNVQVKNGSVSIGTGDKGAVITPGNTTEVTYEVSLDMPGDFYEFTVDAVNAGTVDAMIDVITSTYKIGNGEVTTITSNNLPSYLNYSVTYGDNIEIESNHKLPANSTETYKVRVEYKRDIDENDLPESNQSIVYSFRVDYVQADSNAILRNINSPFITEVDVESVKNLFLFTDDYDINYDTCLNKAINEWDYSSEDAELYCSGEETSEGYSIQKNIDNGGAEWLEKNGIITINSRKYMKLKYDIDEDTCLNVAINDWGDSSEYAELFCSGEVLSDGWSIQMTIDEEGTELLKEQGIITNVIYEEVIPEIIIAGYDGDVPTNLVIPSTINGREVVGIADEAFKGKGITSVEIPNTVKYIGGFAFDENTLVKVNIKSSDTTIGVCAFGNKNDITINNLPESYFCSGIGYTVSDANQYIGQAIPNGVNVRTTPALAMADWQDITGTPGDTKPFYLKHTIENGLITESYVEFIVTDDMASNNEGMVAGTYTLRGAGGTNCVYDNNQYQLTCDSYSPYYESNVNTMKTAFGYSTHPERCSTYGQAENGSLDFNCYMAGLNADAYLNGYVVVESERLLCDVGSNGFSRCGGAFS